jgi:hypothetical protein
MLHSVQLQFPSKVPGEKNFCALRLQPVRNFCSSKQQTLCPLYLVSFLKLFLLVS